MSNSLQLSALSTALLVLHFAVPVGAARQSREIERVIIATAKPYAAVVERIQSLGGRVSQEYKYVDAIAAEVPADSVAAVIDLVGEDAVVKDEVIPSPVPPADLRRALAANVGVYVGGAVSSPRRIFPASPADVPSEQAYKLNHAGLNLRQLHASGLTGRGVVVAVIDSGLRPGFAGLELGRSIAGAEDFFPDPHAPGTPEPDLSISISNDPHGTFVSTMISGNASFSVPPSPLGSAIRSHFPGALQEGRLSLFGSAPESKIYSLRVFSSDALAGASKSIVMAAMDRVIELREMYDHGNPRGANIKVCNLSFGTSTIYAGRTPFERLIDEMVRRDILPVVAAGNVGPSSLTVGSPGTAFSALATGASSTAAGERLFRDVDGFLAPGVDWRPTTHTQTAWFSSRGPTADGRDGPNVMAAGFGVVSQGCGAVFNEEDGSWQCTNSLSTLDISSGSSFSTPIVSGIAAALRQRFPSATAAEVRNAIILSASRDQIGDGSTSLDQGEGLVDAWKAHRLLRRRTVPDMIPRPPHASSEVESNIERQTHLNVSRGFGRKRFNLLKPGQRDEILLKVPVNTEKVIVDLYNVLPELPPEQQNPIFGDDIFLNIHSSKTSSIGVFGDYAALPNGGFTLGGTFEIPDPEPGIIRITVMGDMSNAGRISGDLAVTAVEGLPAPPFTHRGKIRNGQVIDIPVAVPPGAASSEFFLEWDENWGKYPANDLDMSVIPPSGNPIGSGATLNNPERVTLSNPAPGLWTVRIHGFAVPRGSDDYRLRVTFR